jgi:4-hydroxy-3-polyprenylbenzoate decarboxylase
MCRLLRNVDFERDIIDAEGILDVLDHTTPTLGYGSKLAIDLTNIEKTEATPCSVAEVFTPAGGVASISREYLAKLNLVVVYADEEWRERIDVESLLAANAMCGVKYIAIFDRGATAMTASDLLWIAAANTDPKRDITITEGIMVIDARSKRPGYGRNPKRFPNVVTSSPEAIALVDKRWEEYGIGTFIESPSRHYRDLLLNDTAEW